METFASYMLLISVLSLFLSIVFFLAQLRLFAIARDVQKMVRLLETKPEPTL